MRNSNRPTLSDKIERVDPFTLRIPNKSIHKHDPLHVEKISDSLDQFDFVDPILVGPNDEVIDGEQRVKAAIRRGLSSIPIIRLNDATPHQVTAIRIALNKTQRGARWDEGVLKDGIGDLIGQGFDVLKLGFDAAEIDALLDPLNVTDDPAPIVDDGAAVVTQSGDIFRLGSHIIGCGDCRDTSFLALLMGGSEAAACIMDPPYNVPVAGHVSGLGKNHHAEFAVASGELSPQEFLGFLTEIIAASNHHVQLGGYQFVFMDWRSMHLLTEAALALGLTHVNTCIWVKSNAGMGSLYRSQHEMIGVFRKPGAKSTNNVKLGKYGRSRSNVWDFRGANAFGGSREVDLKDHPTVKPTLLVEGAIKDCTKRGEIVLDLFGGSGTTMIAAERCGRKSVLVEIEPRYVDVALRRMSEAFEIDAVHVATGLTFEQLRDQRLAEAQS